MRRRSFCLDIGVCVATERKVHLSFGSSLKAVSFVGFLPRNGKSGWTSGLSVKQAVVVSLKGATRCTLSVFLVRLLHKPLIEPLLAVKRRRPTRTATAESGPILISGRKRDASSPAVNVRRDGGIFHPPKREDSVREKRPGPRTKPLPVHLFTVDHIADYRTLARTTATADTHRPARAARRGPSVALQKGWFSGLSHARRVVGTIDRSSAASEWPAHGGVRHLRALGRGRN